MDGLGGLDRWLGGSTETSVLLIEGPGVEIRLDGQLLNHLYLRFPKYPLHLLAANMAIELDGRLPQILDLKSCRRASSASQHRHSMAYEGRDLEFAEVGSSDDLVAESVAQFEVICISCTYTMERRAASRLIARIRDANPCALIVVGGHDATVSPFPYLASGADICILGEGETVLGDILGAKDGAELRRVRGLAYLADDGSLRRNGKRPIHNLGKLRYPDPHLFLDKSMEYPDGPWPLGVGPDFLVVETSRGCDQACSFCSSTFVAGRFRSWCVQGMTDYLARAAKAGVNTLLFADDNLLYRLLPQYGGQAGRDELIAFFRWLRAHGFCWTFYNGLQFGLLETDGRIDQVLIEALFGSGTSGGHLAGCFEAYIPLERFDDEGRAALSKLRANDVQRDILSCIAGQGTHQLNLGFIIGEPGDSRATLDRFAEEASALDDLVRRSSGNRTRVRHLPWCSIPLPGTPNRSAFQHAIQYDLDRYPELHSNYISVIQGKGMEPIDFTLGRLRLEETLNAAHCVGQGSVSA